MDDKALLIPITETVEALQWLALYGSPSQQISAKAALESMGQPIPSALPRASSDPPPPLIRGNARHRGNFGSYEAALDYIIDAGIPLEYCWIDSAGNLWVIS